jgi:ribosome recycling factor
MTTAIDALKHQFTTLRTVRVGALLDGVMVTRTNRDALEAGVQPDGSGMNLIVAQPWDKMCGEIDKAIRKLIWD